MKHPHPGVEVELKLLVPAEAVRRLSAHPLLQGRARAVRRRLHSVYFDTPAFDLWRQGIALRVRREGRRWLQTVKGGGMAQGGLHQRAEAEAEVAGPAPDISRIRDRKLADAFASPQLRARLRPVFTTAFTRDSRVLELDAGARVEASVDQGVIRSGNRAEALSELELELRGGTPRHLYELALKLAEDVPLSIGDRSKAERGYALARGEPEAPVKARPAVLDRSMSVSDAFKAVMWANLSHLQANERGMLAARDPEYLHQMRVALRRLRSAFNVFAPLLPQAAMAPWVAELRWLASGFGPARDWDVFMTETLASIEKEFGAHGELKAFSERCRELRRGANVRARRAVRSARYQRLMLALAGWLAAGAWLARLDRGKRVALESPVEKFAAAVLEKRHTRVRKRARGLGGLSAPDRHRLRIAVKKFRYATDFFSGLFSAHRSRAMRGRLARLQDILGAMNDAATGARLVARGIGRVPGGSARRTRSVVLGWVRNRDAALKRELQSAWKVLRLAEKFW